jgi:hypothetical protein
MHTLRSAEFRKDIRLASINQRGIPFRYAGRVMATVREGQTDVKFAPGGSPAEQKPDPNVVAAQ